jgi:hypothetical protein
MTSETWRCQPCQERVSLWSMPSSFLAALSSIAQRRPSEEGEFTIDDVAANEEPARPHDACECGVIFAGVGIGEFEIGPVVEPLSLVPSPWARIARCLGAHPACLAPLVAEQTVEQLLRRSQHAILREQPPHPTLHLTQQRRPQAPSRSSLPTCHDPRIMLSHRVRSLRDLLL